MYQIWGSNVSSKEVVQKQEKKVRALNTKSETKNGKAFLSNNFRDVNYLHDRLTRDTFTLKNKKLETQILPT